MPNRKSISLLRSCGLIAVSAAAVGAVWAVRNKRLFTVCDITTGESLDYPELRAHVYYALPDVVLDATIAALESLPGCRIVQRDSEEGFVMAEAQVGADAMVHQIAIHALPLGERHTRAVIRSRSFGGRGDLGENARRIREIQSAMDRLLVGG